MGESFLANKQAIIDSELHVHSKVIALVTCIGQEYKSEMTRRIAPMNISIIQLNILHTLSFAPDRCLTVNQIKQVMIDDSPNVSRALNKLMDANFIEKQRSSEDQRVVHIHLTDEGQRVHLEADALLIEGDVPLNNLSEQEVEQLYGLLKKL